MKIRVSLFVLLAPLLGALIAVPVISSAEKEETELSKHMEKMSPAFRKLRRQVSDSSKNADSLKQVAILKQNAEAGLKLEPAMKAEIPAAQQAKFVSDYREKMKEMIAMVGKLEAALKADKNDEAAKLLGTLGDAQKQGHKQFKKKDE